MTNASARADDARRLAEILLRIFALAGKCWASGQVVVVGANADLANPIWSPLQTNTLSSDSLYFSDPQWTNYPARFYRVRSP